MDENIKNNEIDHLNQVTFKLENTRSDMQNTMKKMGATNLDRLKELRENPETGADFQIFLEQLHEKNLAFNFKDKYQRLEEYDYLLKEPYFARIDISDTNQKNLKSVYIGKFGYSEKEPIVTDWRTKVASLYYRYRYPQKNVKYETPEGAVTKDLKLKRTYEISDGELIKYYNNDIQFDENEIMIEKIEQRTGGVLEDIVETIQESQLDIIESDPRQICIVQGCVGSGKSTVAIHKLSHVFFNFPKYIRPSRSILVAKNQILVGYLSTLFPKLGIFDINYKTLRDLVVNLIFREELKIHYNLDKEEDTSSIDIDYIKKLNEEINKIHIQVKDVIENIFTDEDLSTFGGYKYSDTMTPYENVTDLISDLEEELSMQKEKLKNNPKSVKSWIFKENVNNLRKIIRKLYRVRTSIKDSNLKSVLRTVNIDIKKELGYLQTLLYLFVYSELVGIKKVQKYEYCVIDEGQDFSSIEYAVLSKFVLRGRFAIFGDLNQSIETDGIGDWTKIEEVIKDASRASVFKLETNYRSTKPIIDYANVILNKYTDNNLPKSINRKGIDPAENIFNNDSDLTTKIKDEIDEDLKNLDKSIGIITFSDKYFDELSEYLRQKDNKNILILDKDKVISYIPKGMYLMKSDDCKGLEFSKVYVVGKNIKKINNFFDAKKAFVAVTRAMNELNVYWKN